MHTDTISLTGSDIDTSVYRRWVVCLSAALFFFYEFIQLNLPNSIAHALMQSFSINATQVGTLSACYFYANILFLFFAGFILDRFSTRKVILYSLAVCIFGTFCFAHANSFLLACLFRFLTGIGSAFCFLSCMRLATRWFPNKQLALISGLIVTMAMAGGMIAQTPLALLIAKVGWRDAILLDAAFGILIFFFVAFLVKDYPKGAKKTCQATRQYNYLQSYRIAFLKWQNWLGGIYTSFLNLPIFILGALWGDSYLQKVHHVSHITAANITSMIFLGTVIGCPIAGWLSDRCGRRRIPMIIGAVLSMLTLCLLVFNTQLSVANLEVLFFCLGFVTSVQIITYPTIAEINPRAFSATAISVISICAIGGGGIFQPLFGLVMDMQGPHPIINHVPVYSAHDYQTAILILPFAFVVALLASFFIRETYCKNISND